jgi:hypothetical protein
MSLERTITAALSNRAGAAASPVWRLHRAISAATMQVAVWRRVANGTLRWYLCKRHFTRLERVESRVFGFGFWRQDRLASRIVNLFEINNGSRRFERGTAGAAAARTTAGRSCPPETACSSSVYSRPSAASSASLETQLFSQM